MPLGGGSGADGSTAVGSVLLPGAAIAGVAVGCVVLAGPVPGALDIACGGGGGRLTDGTEAGTLALGASPVAFAVTPANERGCGLF
jgi:hypothetical protein